MPLTELEGAALGLMWSQGPITAYRLRKLVAKSPTPHWSASAGSVYPLVEKLCRGRLISFSITGDRRGTRHLRITPSGKRAFRTWLLDCSPAVIGVPADPVRTRVRFLDVLSPPERARFIADLESRLRRDLARMRALPGGDSPTESLASLGARLLQKQRVKWIAAAKKLTPPSRGLASARRRSP